MNLPDLTFTTLKRDFESLKNEMISRIAFFTPEWTDRSLADPGIGLIHVFAWVLDAYHWVAEMLLNEAFLATCKRRSSLILHLGQQGTTVQPPTAATSDLILTVESIETGLEGASLKKGFQFQASLPSLSVVFETLSTVDLPGVGESVTVTVREQQSTYANLGAITGRPFQRMIIPTTTILQNASQQTLTVLVGTQKYDVVDSFAFSGPADKHVMAERNSERYLVLTFGDGNKAFQPPTGANVTSYYAEGGGVNGNKASKGTITKILNSVPYGYRLSVTNPSDASGGGDWETFEQARNRAPYHWASQERAVTPPDYEALTLAVPGVLKCRMEPRTYSTVVMWVVPQGGGQASTALRQEIITALTDKVSTDGLSIGEWDPDAGAYRTANYVGIDIAARVRVLDTYSQSVTRAAVILAAQNWLAASARDFGELPSGRLYLGDCYELLEAVEGVSSVDILAFTRRLEPVWVTKSGDATLTSGSILTDATPDEKWWVEFLSPVWYRVYGENCGGQGMGSVGARFTGSSGYFSLVVTGGTQEMATGDKFWFRTCPRVANIPIDPMEFPTLNTLRLSMEGGY